MHPRRVAPSCLALSLSLALVGCSGTGTGSGAPSGPKNAAGSQSAASPSTAGASRTTSPSAAAAVSAGRQLTGTELAKLLLTGSDLPGFAPTTGGALNSGADLTTGAAKYPLASLSCNSLANDFDDTGFGESAMATDMLANSTNGDIFDEAVYQFATPAAASAFYTRLKTVWLSCGRFTANDGSGNTGILTATATSAPSGLGRQDFGFTLKGTTMGAAFAEGNTIVLDGVDVYALSPGKQGSTVPTDLDPATLTQKLIDRVATG